MNTLKLPIKPNKPNKPNKFKQSQIKNTPINLHISYTPKQTYVKQHNNTHTDNQNTNNHPYESEVNHTFTHNEVNTAQISFKEAATRRIEQKKAKLARQNSPITAQKQTIPILTISKSTKIKCIQDDVHATQPFFASCPRGLEWALVQELENMGITITKRVASGAMLSATWTQILQANIYSRIASRFLWQLSTQFIRNEEEIYTQATRIPWENFFDVNHTLKVTTVGIRAEVRSLEFISLRIKDAICDRFRSINGSRPTINTHNPDIRVICVLEGLFNQIYLDTSGEPLFKRGWREGDNKGEAALKENLAAGLLALTGWNGSVPLYDPMCGSGTFIIEAAQTVYQFPPNTMRNTYKQFAMYQFKHLNSLNLSTVIPSNSNINLHHSITKSVPVDSVLPQLFASDINPEMVHITARNIQKSGLSGDKVHLACMDILDMSPPTTQAGILVLNPPYGERMGFSNHTGEIIEADLFYEAFAKKLKQQFKGWSVWILTSDEKVQARMRLKPNATHSIFNGAIACRWLKFNIT